jgi:hypothetical protein
MPGQQRSLDTLASNDNIRKRIRLPSKQLKSPSKALKMLSGTVSGNTSEALAGNYPRYRWTFKSPLRALPARVDDRRRLTLRCTKSSSISASPTVRGILPRVSRGAERMEVFKMRSESSQPGRRYASRPAPNCATPHLCRPSYVSDSSLNASGADAHLAIAGYTPYLDLFLWGEEGQRPVKRYKSTGSLRV